MIKQDPRTIIDSDSDHTFNKPIHSVSTIKLGPRTLGGKYNLQWVRDKLDTRDYVYNSTNVRTAATVDLRRYCTKVEDQGNLGSCTGNAIAGAIEFLNKKNNRVIDISRLFIYYYVRLIEGTVNYDSGAYIRDGIKACYKYGASSERLWPYNISKFRSKPSAAAINDGLQRKITRYERITDQFDGSINALSNQYPVIMGFDVYSSFISVGRTGIMTYPNKRTERLLGGHAVLLVGYDMNRQAFIARNSWGTAWGLQGYFYMPFRVVQDTTMSDDFWIIKTVNNP
jgi:C1A family cysteine protease